MEQESREKYKIVPPAAWVETVTDEQLLSQIVETDFSQRQYDDGRDYCYFLRKVQYTDDIQNAEYNFMAYSVQQPGTLDFASVNEFVLYQAEHIEFHRIAVLREGVLIDKLPDTTFKVLDNETQSIDGVLNSSKKVNIVIKDIRLHDIMIVEDTRVVHFTEKDFLRKALIKYIWFSPDVYWAYGKYEFDLINKRQDPIRFKKLYFRDDLGELLPIEEGLIGPGETFSLGFTDYINAVDINREVYPFIDFATDRNYEELMQLVYAYYQTALATKSLDEYAPELVTRLDALNDLDAKIQFAIEYVQNSVRYLYNEDEMHGHKPQDPWVTYAFKQGDCKAKTILLKSILQYLGVECSIVLVNFNADFYVNKYLPSLFNFNHVILKIAHQNVDYFVDATSRDEYGSLENRSFISFLNYLEIKPESTMQQRKGYKSPGFSIFDQILFEVKNDVGFITLKTTYRYNRANAMRRYFKNTNKKAIVDHTNNFVFSCMDIVEPDGGNDKRDIFKDATITVVHDDKTDNLFITEYTATIEKPYYITSDGRKYLKFYDASILKQNLRDYVQKDVSFWQSFESEKYQINIRSDKPIDVRDEVTNKQLAVEYELFKYTIKKKIERYGAVADIEFVPLSNVEVPVSEIPSLRDKYAEIGRSAYGLGVGIAKPTLLDSLKSMFRKA
ncbi:hypothetical protein [Sphingobacterium paludis]|uniref:Transglutaminase superfamily protein n=1 Tax=Sphingobacterium paludis TaxID=1476465 RepID=A0A4R7DAA7_9SPHI|nr:hypothetical protein [Sphingobacterium paludis]TDS15996.1 hypothetical protein B0I21_102318 [Sphingobacterium paludis]